MVTVAQDFDPHRVVAPDYNGMLAYDDEWLDNLAILIESQELRQQMAAQALDDVLAGGIGSARKLAANGWRFTGCWQCRQKFFCGIPLPFMVASAGRVGP
jgi:hypothetical protein